MSQGFVHTISTAIWVVSVVLHAIAAAFAVRLLRHSPHRIGWMLIAGAFVLMTLHRAMPLLFWIQHGRWESPELVGELVALVIAALMVAGVALIMPLLLACKRSEELYEVLQERQTAVNQLIERLVRTFQQLKVAVEVGKPPTLLLSWIEETMVHLQRFAEELKAGIIVGKNFELSLRSLVDSMLRDRSLRVNVDVEPGTGKRLSQEDGTQLLALVREAVDNIRKHSGASKGWVSVTQNNGTMHVEIKDNGRGFEVDLVEVQGRGLGSMIARAKKIGAKLKIHSRPKEGTRILVEVPVHDEVNAP